MIHATKDDVDQAKKDLARHLEDLAYALRDWCSHPHSATQQQAARHLLDDADLAFAAYETTLTAWAAGPGASQ